MMINLEELLAPRIHKNCFQLHNDGHFKHAAREAMVQVELALKERGKVEDIQFGATLIGNLFAGKQGVKLRVPLGDKLQKQAEQYFKGVFAYYRNYIVHDGSNVDERIAVRVLIIASELLELIDASTLTLTDSGGIDGLVKVGGFDSPERLSKLLTLLDGYHMPKLTYDGLFEELASVGFGDSALEAAIELNLVEMHSAEYESPHCTDDLYQDIGLLEWFQLTELGRKALEAAKLSD